MEHIGMLRAIESYHDRHGRFPGYGDLELPPEILSTFADEDELREAWDISIYQACCSPARRHLSALMEHTLEDMPNIGLWHIDGIDRTALDAIDAGEDRPAVVAAAVAYDAAKNHPSVGASVAAAIADARWQLWHEEA